MKNLLNFSPCEAAKFLESFDVIISDLNGVLFYQEPIAGAEDGLKKLREHGKKFYFVSNNTSYTTEMFKEMFLKLSHDVQENDVIHPTLAAADYLKSINFDKHLFCISNEKSITMLTDAGIKCVSEETIDIKSAEVMMKKIMDDPSVGGVYVDADPNMSYMNVCKALSILQRDETILLIGARDKLIPISKTRQLIGQDAFQDIIIERSKKKPTFLGKPSEYLKTMIFKRFNVTNPRRVLFVGDTLEFDMAFGTMCGFQKLLVLTGIASLKDITRRTECYLLPDYYIDSFGDMVKVVEIAEKNKKSCMTCH